MLLLYCYTVRIICIAVVVIVAVFRGAGGDGEDGVEGERHVFWLPRIRFVSAEHTCYDKKNVIGYKHNILRESITLTSG